MPTEPEQPPLPIAPSRNVFAPVIGAIGLLVLGGYLAILASGAAGAFLPSLNVPEPALAETAPPHNQPPPRLTERVVLVIVDGLRLRDSHGLPYLDSLRRQGIDAAARASYPTISWPNYVSILTGVPPAWSGVRNNHYRGHTVTLDSIMRRARAAGLPAAWAGDYTNSIGFMFTDDFDELSFAPWPGGMVRSARLLIARDYPLVVLLPGLVDEVGHLEGAASQAYRDAVRQVDRELSEALADLDLTRDTVIVVADHGHTDRGGHGGLEPDVLEVPLIMAGAGIRAGAVLPEVPLVDVAPTVAALLGVPAPRHGFGRTVVDALTHEEQHQAALVAADAERVAVNEAFAAAQLERARPAVFRSRLARVASLVGFLTAAFVGLLLARRWGFLHIDWRVLLFSLPAFPLSYYLLLDITLDHFSLSAINNRDDTLEQLFHFGLAATGVHLVASWVVFRGRVVLRDRLATANGLTLCGMFVAWIPAGFMWAIFAAPPFVKAPGSVTSVLVPATYVAVFCYAIAAAVTLGLEIIIFFARAVDPRLRLRRLARAAERERRRLETEPDADERDAR